MLDERHDTLTIRTPEGIVFSLALAGPARRFLAWGIDAAITTSAVLAVFAALAFGDLVRADLIRAAGIISFFAIKLTYVILSEWFWRGQTLGKFVLGLRVMDVQGLRLHFNQIVLRNLMRILDAMPFFYLAGGLSMLFSRRCQRLGD